MTPQTPSPQAWFCHACGASNLMVASFCTSCGTQKLVAPDQQVNQQWQPQQFQPQYFAQPIPQVQQVVIVDLPKSRAAYILLGLFLGGLGIHNFYAGRNGAGAAQLIIMMCTFWLIIPIFMIGLWVIVELIAVTHDGRGRPMR